MNVYFKTLIHNGEWVDLSLIDKGLYTAQIPYLIQNNNVKDIEEIIENWKGFYKSINKVMSISQIENLKKCELITIEIKKCKD